MTPLLTIKSTVARVAGWAWMVFAALNLIDIAVRGRDMASVVMTTLLLLGCGIAYAVGLRPAVVADEQGYTVRNPLRDTRVPWRASRKIEAADALLVTFKAADGERKTKAWVHQTSPRARAKAEARERRQAARMPDAAATALKHGTPTMFAAQQLNELAREHKGKGDADQGTVAWSRPAVAAVAVPGALAVAASLIALLS
ncbi:PH domain-containing protein [Spirillospora sp. NPDC029432]|uniref:PH domain-containing protein n=1 Tax=Spirillospora sp. NPDC029432 TaxID=3154599 RepID=UPI003457365B